MSIASMAATDLGKTDSRPASSRQTPFAAAPLATGVAAVGSPAPLGDWTTRLIDDAAAELRTPLSGIAESLRAVSSGELGQLSALQRDCLADATAACRRIDQMISGLRRLDQQRSGAQGVTRCWFDPQTLRLGVERAIAQSLPHRHASITWHGMEAGQHRVFGDPWQVRLLLVGLLSDAIRRAPAGAQLLVRAIPVPGGQRVRLSVVGDRLAAQRASENFAGPAAAALTDGADDLASWQPMAAALLTDLSLHHRTDRGREIHFELPAAGLRSVALQWAQWRIEHDAKRRPRLKTEPLDRSGRRSGAPLFADQAAVLTVRAGAAVSPDTVEAFDRKLQRDARLYDLVYRTSPRRWVVLWDASANQARARMEQLAAGELNTASPLRLSWSAIGRLPIRDGQTATLLADRLARESLSEAEAAALYVEQPGDAAQPLLTCSPTPGDRLGEQLKHLAARVSAQNALLQQQAQALRHRS